jgi:hypothetical protein
MRVKEIKTKMDLIQFIKEQINIELPNDELSPLNRKKKVLYTEFPRWKDGVILSLLAKYKIKYEGQKLRHTH